MTAPSAEQLLGDVLSALGLADDDNDVAVEQNAAALKLLESALEKAREEGAEAEREERSLRDRDAREAARSAR